MAVGAPSCHPYGPDVSSMTEVPGADLYQSVLYLYLSAGGAAALTSLCLGVFRFRILGQLLCLLVAFLALWASLIIGVHEAYGAWQGMDNPPDEAFADGAKLTGSVLFGWMICAPACALAWLAISVAKKLLWPKAGAEVAT